LAFYQLGVPSLPVIHTLPLTLAPGAVTYPSWVAVFFFQVSTAAIVKLLSLTVKVILLPFIIFLLVEPSGS